MLTITLIVRNQGNKVIVYQSSIIPRINETVVCEDRTFKVLDVVYKTNDRTCVHIPVREVPYKYEQIF